MIENFKKHVEFRMEKCIATFKNQIRKMYSGRASPNLLDSIIIECYGNMVSIRKIANITVIDVRTLKISMFDCSLKPIVEKAIMMSNLGLNPNSDGSNIYVSLPVITEERRKHIIKLIRSEAEQARISVRSIRRDANDHIQIFLKEKKISEDDERLLQNNVQKLTDSFIKKIEEAQEHKEKELMCF